MELRKNTKEELQEILKKHKLWLKTKGKEGERANLTDAILSYANLTGANLPENEKYRLGIILKEPIIGYKKCRDDVIVKLEIPKGAIVFSINGKKCRTNIAKVLEISGDNKEAFSIRDSKFIYKVGKTYKIKDFYSVYNVECSTGIHFFKTRKEAEEYQY